MVASINSSNTFTLQSGISQTSSSEINSLSSKTKEKNPFVRKMGKNRANLNFDEPYKIELGADKLHGTLEKKSYKNDMTPREINNEIQKEEIARRSWNKINETTLKSAVKLYSILKGDILLKNYFDFKTGSVNFFA